MASKTRDRQLPAPPIPAAFLERMAALLGGEFPAFLASYGAQSVQALRVNTLKLEPAELAGRVPFNLEPVPWSRETFVISESTDRQEKVRPGKHPYHAAGLYYLQDPSATAPVELLDPQPGETILDLSAAPGGKSTHIAGRLRGQGLLVTNEVIPKRAWELAGNLERWGATNVAVTAETPERLAARWPGFFDAVLVDAPCSGEGMFRKGEAARREWTPALIHGCATRQDGILEQAAALVRSGGRLVYSTCTFAPEEDEGTVARFLQRHLDFELLEPPTRPGFDRGRPEWLPPELRRPELARCVRLWPHHVRGEGHFAALLHKRADDSATVRSSEQPTPRLPKHAGAAYAAFVADTFVRPPTGQSLILSGAYLYAAPSSLPDLPGLRYLHPGWWLGEVKTAQERARFEPSHALALGIAVSAVRRVVDFPVDSGGLAAYLRGETTPSAGDDGWTLVTVDGFSIGWAKRVGGRLKSHYPKGLRLLRK